MKTRRFKRPIYFVCSAIKEGNLLTETIESEEKDKAIKIFYEIHKVSVNSILGPFYKKRIFNYLPEPEEIIFGTETKRAEYHGWLVNATYLKKPTNCAFLLFDIRIDGQKFPRPQGIKIVKIEDLKIKE